MNPEKNLMKNENLCERKKVRKPPLSQESIPRGESNLAPELFKIFKRQSLPNVEAGRGNMKSYDFTITLPCVETNDIAQVCTAGTRLGNSSQWQARTHLDLGNRLCGRRMEWNRNLFVSELVV